MKILLRSRQDPFTPKTARRTLDRNLIGDNVGNLVFSHAAHRVLSVSGSEVTSSRGQAVPMDAGEINETYDVFVIPLANAFRLSYRPRLEQMSDLIERLKIPVVVVGVGAQAGMTGDVTRLKQIDDSVCRFVRAVLDRSASIGVRGEVTLEYLNRLGFRDVEVIGCPSLFLRGPDLAVQKRVTRLTPDSPLSISISPYVKAMGPITMSAYARYDDLLYVAQDIATLGLLLDGEPEEAKHRRSLVPVHTTHPMFRENKIRFPLEPWTWFDLLRTRQFAFGSRIHGTIAALLAGTPAVLLAHDSRTLELARYHEIPYRLVSEVPPDLDPATLYEQADFTAFHAGHAERLARFTDFLERNGLPHVFAGDRVDPGAQAYDDRVAAATFRPPVTPGDASEPSPRAGLTPLRRLAGRVARRTGVLRG